MKALLLATTALITFSALAYSQQETKADADYLGQTWVGLLVSSDCEGGAASAKKALDSASDLTTSGRTTTPAVDASGTRGSSTAGETATQPPVHDALPRTGDILSRTKEAVKDPGWDSAKKQAGRLTSGCSLIPDTRGFALLLADGRLLRFDDLANAAIAKQLRERKDESRKSVVLRVRVTGKLQNSRIALDTIQL